ncbi:MAG: IS4 family transposase [Chitinophagales bacterium]
MNTGKYVFSQVTSLLDPNDFTKCIKKYNGNYKVKHFTCWHQLMCLMFGQLSHRESLSDLITCLSTQQNQWYHLGMGTGLSKNNLAHANEHRDWRIFADYAYMLITEARKVCRDKSDLELKVEGNVYAIDSTTIDLCLSVFWWAKFRKQKGAVKMHTQLDVKTGIPTFIHISDGSVADVNFLDFIEIEAGSIYVLDKGYWDFDRLFKINSNNAFFVTRLKNNTNYRRLYSAKVDRTTGVICDQTIRFNNYQANKDYPEKLRRIKYYDTETSITFEFATNNFQLTALEIALLYKNRWQVELFFKWIKQHLKIKSFWGYSENAVRIQIYTAIIAYITVVMMKQKMKIPYSTYEILQILSLTMLNKSEINQLFQPPHIQRPIENNANQLILF